MLRQGTHIGETVLLLVTNNCIKNSQVAVRLVISPIKLLYPLRNSDKMVQPGVVSLAVEDLPYRNGIPNIVAHDAPKVVIEAVFQREAQSSSDRRAYP